MKKSIYFSGSYLSLVFILLFPGTGVVQKYFGLRGVSAYVVLGTLTLIMSIHFILPSFFRLITERSARMLAILTLVMLIVVFSLIYPRANATTGQRGSDADDALNLAAVELIHGRYPYRQKTYLENPITPLPGAILLASPFVLLGNSAYQNLFWLAVFLIVSARLFSSRAKTLALLWIMLAFTPTVMQNLVTGTDYLSNAIYVLTAFWFAIRVVSNPLGSIGKKLASGIFLGVSLSSRFNFLLLTPLLFSALVQNAGWKAALRYCSVTALVFAGVTLPFWLYDWKAFSPAANQFHKVAMFANIIPYSGLLITAAGVFVAVILSLRRMDHVGPLFSSCGLVQMTVVCFTVAASSVQAGRLDLTLANYGLFFLFFAVLPAWDTVTRKPSPGAAPKPEVTMKLL